MGLYPVARAMGKGQRFTREYLEDIPEFDPAVANRPQICRVAEIRGKGIVQVQLASGELTLAVLPPRFRGTLWLRRGALVIAADIPVVDEADKVTLSIERLLTAGDVKEFTKLGHIPEAFKRPPLNESSSEEEAEEQSSSEDESEYYSE